MRVVSFTLCASKKFISSFNSLPNVHIFTWLSSLLSSLFKSSSSTINYLLVFLAFSLLPITAKSINFNLFEYLLLFLAFSIYFAVHIMSRYYFMAAWGSFISATYPQIPQFVSLCGLRCQTRYSVLNSFLTYIITQVILFFPITLGISKNSLVSYFKYTCDLHNGHHVKSHGFFRWK